MRNLLFNACLFFGRGASGLGWHWLSLAKGHAKVRNQLRMHVRMAFSSDVQHAFHATLSTYFSNAKLTQ